MLAQLFIRNIAVIEKASIDLEKGFTVLTGETGAGKSIIIDAIHAVLGERTSKELVRTGTDSASVSALFTGLDEDTLSLLDRLSLPREEDGSLLIQRDIRLEGRSTCKINGAPATVSMLKQLGPRLVTIHGQHESYELLSPEVHMEYLDSFAGLESLLAEYQAAYRTLRETQRQLEALQTDEGEKARLSDLLHYQIDEIEAANVRVGEREELEAQRELIRNSEKIASALELLRGLLSGDEESEGLLAGISQAAAQAGRVAAYLPELAEASQKLQEAGYLLEDVDAILHGGDINKPGIVEQLEQYAPLYVVRGNNDKEWAEQIPHDLTITLGGVTFYMVHNKKEVPADLTGIDAVVFGHSHKYLLEERDGVLWLNPGSCGPRRFHQEITMMTAEVEGGRIAVSKILIPHEAK